jgi:hypothetical protein
MSVQPATAALYDGTTLPAPAAVIAEYDATIHVLSNALTGLVHHELTVTRAKADLASFEAATLLAEGPDGQRLVTGKNEAERAASLLRACEDDGEWVAALAQRVEAEREVALGRARVTSLQARLRFHADILGYLTAVAHLGPRAGDCVHGIHISQCRVCGAEVPR